MDLQERGCITCTSFVFKSDTSNITIDYAALSKHEEPSVTHDVLLFYVGFYSAAAVAAGTRTPQIIGEGMNEALISGDYF